MKMSKEEYNAKRRKQYFEKCKRKYELDETIRWFTSMGAIFIDITKEGKKHI